MDIFQEDVWQEEIKSALESALVLDENQIIEDLVETAAKMIRSFDITFARVLKDSGSKVN